MNGFHAQKNLYFKRGDDGSVTVTKYRDDATVFDLEGGEKPVFAQTLDADTWCSVIASMSAGGEEDERWFAAGTFHRSKGRLIVAPLKRMVDRFLSWKLPENFRPDAGISFEPRYNVDNIHGWPEGKHEPTGTNLFDATQAEAMVRHMAEETNPG